MEQNVFYKINKAVLDFVNQPDTAILKNGTGSWSIPFRGTLFNTNKTKDVISELNSGKKVDVLWLGSNPNVPNSIDAIVNNKNLSYIDGFIEQMESEYFSEFEWDPINKPSGGWRFYSDIFNDSNLNVLMYNYIVWGSGDFETFIKDMSNYDRKNGTRVLTKLINFSNELTKHIIKVFQPKLVFVPKSIAEADRSLNILLSREETQDISDSKYPHQNKTGRTTSFNYYAGSYKYDKSVKILCTPHPSYVAKSGMLSNYALKDKIQEKIKSLTNS